MTVSETTPSIKPVWQLCLGLYQLFCGVLAVYFLIQTWLNQFILIDRIFHAMPQNDVDIALLKTLSYTVTGSVIGSVIISLKGLHVHGAVQREFRLSYTTSYLLGPWFAALLGIAVYGLMRAGIFVFSGVSEISNPNEATQFGYVGLGFLTGFGWLRVLDKIDAMLSQLLSSTKGADEGSAVRE